MLLSRCLTLILALLLWNTAVGAEPVHSLHWSFKPLQSPPIPPTQDLRWAATPVDCFVLERLEAAGLTPTVPADRRKLVRRASFDLTGLPPSPEDVERVLADPSPDCFERLLDRLLESEHFGERWGRHWLDWSGYVDVIGGDNDAGTVKLGEGKWRYRDYVIRAFNRDMRFDEFVTEQLAGDETVDWRNASEFTPDIVNKLTATTFLRPVADDTDENELNTPDVRHGVWQRTAEGVANNLLALTLHCAKCHDHKYDPISQRDYYRFAAHFAPAFNPERWLQPKDRNLPDISTIEKKAADQFNQEVDAAVARVDKRRAELEAPVRSSLLEGKLAKLPAEIRADLKSALQTASEKRSEVQKYLSDKFEKDVLPTPEQIRAALGESVRAEVAAAEEEIIRLNHSKKRWGILQAVYDVGLPSPTRILRRGNHLNPGDEVSAGFLTALCMPNSADDKILRSDSGAECVGATSGRRLRLARWLSDGASPASALMSRVMVNRMWQQLFGVGLVETSDNFGIAGARPSHPELLEWLASRFIQSGWRIKPMLRLIMTSATYLQSSAAVDSPATDRANAVDPDNRLLWKQRLRRLDAEVIRDSLLAVADLLDPAIGGMAMPIEYRPDGMMVLKGRAGAPPAQPSRRSVYVLARRNYPLSFLATFDQPIMVINCARRTPSAVVSQALTMLNDAFVEEQSAALAKRVEQATAHANPAQKIAKAFQWALSRPPAPDEMLWCEQFLSGQTSPVTDDERAKSVAQRQALSLLCQALVNSSEFLYIE